MRPLIALSLGGGGAKTFAHLGAIDALKEAKIPIDFLVTCSAASVIGFLVALGVPSQEIKREFNKRKWFRLIRRSIFKDILKKYIKEKRIRDISQTKIPISIVTVDLKRNEEIVFEKGDPLIIPFASSAFPGIWRPIKYKDYYLADGGILNPDPSDVARQKVGKDGIVISITLKLEFIEEKPGNRLNVLLKAIYSLPFKRRNEIMKKNSDFIISPLKDLKISFRDWKETFLGYFRNNKIEEFYQKGYLETKKVIPQILKKIEEKEKI